ncbi:MAG: CinA family protein [Longimicrobiales bacterium]
MTDLVGAVSEALTRRGLSLAVAESCTGGLVAARLTARPGASRFLEAGLVTYSDAAKESLLDVAPETLAAHGAVSEAVARAMIQGVRVGTGAEAAIAITGVAGPGGGTAEKPVGTVWIGVALNETVRVRRFHFEGDRGAVRDASVNTALELLHGILEETA